MEEIKMGEVNVDDETFIDSLNVVLSNFSEIVEKLADVEFDGRGL